MKSVSHQWWFKNSLSVLLSSSRCGFSAASLSVCTPRSLENLKIILINSWKSTQCMFYIRPLYLRRTTEGDYNTPFSVSEQRHAMRPGKWRHSGKVTWRYNNIKRSGKYSSDFMQNFAEKNKYLCVVQMHGSEHTWRFSVFSVCDDCILESTTAWLLKLSVLYIHSFINASTQHNISNENSFQQCFIFNWSA